MNEGCKFFEKERITKVVKEGTARHYKNITFFENRDRFRLLSDLSHLFILIMN